MSGLSNTIGNIPTMIPGTKDKDCNKVSYLFEKGKVLLKRAKQRGTCGYPQNVIPRNVLAGAL
jgi:hypothetical protein